MISPPPPVFKTKTKTETEPLPNWCGPILMGLTRAHPEHSCATIAQAIREALVVQRDYDLKTSLERLAGRLLGAG
jgi:hypothetical protein